MFREGSVEADGVRLRYREAGQGVPLVDLRDAGPLSPAHDLLACRFRVIALAMPDAGPSPTPSQLAAALGRAITALGVDRFNLMAGSLAGATALRLAAQEPERVLALVLESPAAIDPDLEGRLADLATPTLAVFGTADATVLPETGCRYPEVLPNGHLVFVYDATGAIAADRPEAFAEVVADFLEHHEAFVISRTPTVIHP